MATPTAPVVIARYQLRESADRACEDLRKAGVDDALIHVGDAGVEPLAEEAHQFRESEDVVPAIGIGAMTRSQMWGSFRDAVIWGVLGAIVVIPLALVTFRDDSIGARLAVWMICGALAGASAGFVYGGGKEPVDRHEVIDQGTSDLPTGTTVMVPVLRPAETEHIVALLRDVDPHAEVAVREVEPRDGEQRFRDG